MPKGKGIQLNDNNDSGEILDVKVIPVRDAFGKIVRGMVVDATLNQNQALILICGQGEVKFSPKIGVGIEDAVLADDFLRFRHRIREHFAMDGLKVTKLDFYTNKPFRVDANY